VTAYWSYGNFNYLTFLKQFPVILSIRMIKAVAPDVQFSAQYANTFAFQYAFHNRQPKLRRKNTVCCHSNLPFAAVCPYFPCLKIGVHIKLPAQLHPQFGC
jgi:hypothetical protein